MAAVQFWPSSPSTLHTAHSSPIVRNDWYQRQVSVASWFQLLLACSSKDTLPGSSRSARPPEGSRALEKLIYTSKRTDTSIAVQKREDEQGADR